MIKVIVFGAFDGLHEGHLHFLREAREHGDYLIAALAEDPVVKYLKGKSPKRSFDERFRELEACGLVHEVAAGDEELGSWDILKKYRPEVIALGYDQDNLREEIENRLEEFGWQVEIKVMSPYKPEIYHSSILRQENIGS